MRFIAVFHVVCAVILAASAVPLSDRAAVAVDSRQKQLAGDNDVSGTADTFNTLDLSRTSASSDHDTEETIKPIEEEVHPEQPAACVIA
ncbi:hypothetical protein GGX14DRAFT_481232 [Mycena pura]|uniref:Uncharacterized protein n=1 Tax=Mycena pura TaxID=153505 RepID=A0AAD6US42_9AGAR|nr:hypothetical protein GGX14DRAFT_481232 [Mycena pura]